MIGLALETRRHGLLNFQATRGPDPADDFSFLDQGLGLDVFHSEDGLGFVGGKASLEFATVHFFLRLLSSR